MQQLDALGLDEGAREAVHDDAGAAWPRAYTRQGQLHSPACTRTHHRGCDSPVAWVQQRSKYSLCTSPQVTTREMPRGTSRDAQGARADWASTASTRMHTCTHLNHLSVANQDACVLHALHFRPVMRAACVAYVRGVSAMWDASVMCVAGA